MRKEYWAMLFLPLLLVATISANNHLKERREQERAARQENLRRNLEFQQEQAEAVLREVDKNNEALKEWGRQYSESLKAEREKERQSASQ